MREIIKNKEIRNKILFTLLCITLFRIGASIPLPIVNTDTMKQLVSGSQFFSMYDLFSGGSLASFSLFALGISPYITASIVINLMTFVLPSLESLSEEGEMGRKKIKRYTKILGLILAFIQSSVLFLTSFRSIFVNNSTPFILFAAGLVTFGVYLLILMDSAIEKKGIGKGASIIICTSILSKMPASIGAILSAQNKMILIPCIVIGVIALIALVVAIQEAVRKVPVNYAKHSISNEKVNLEKSYLPFKINQSSITPVIFAQTILTIPTLVATVAPNNVATTLNKLFNPTSVTFNLFLVVLIVFFNYFYTNLAFDVDKLADNLKKANGFVNGVRPGEATANYLGKIMNRLVFVGCIFLIFVTILPTVVNSTANISIALIGTSLLIVTSTIIDIIKQIKAQITYGEHRSFFNF